MSMRWLTLVCLVPLVGGCNTPPLRSIDQTVSEVVAHPFDVAPGPARKPVEPAPAEGAVAPTPPAVPAMPVAPPPDATAAPHAANGPRRDANIVQASFTPAGQTARNQPSPTPAKFQLTIPPEIPGSETPLVTLPDDREKRPEAIAHMFPRLPPLPEEPIPQPGPDGRPYTLADLQRLAAANSPLLRQAAADVEAARGLMVQAGLYPNPTVGYETAPNANNTGSTTLGVFVDQVIKMGGKLTLASAAARMNLIVAQLAFLRARYNLATTIRGDYYTLLVAKETVRVNKGLAHFTDEIYRLQADLLAGGFAASHEATALRSQSFLVRLGYKQAIANYMFAWKELVADLGLKQLPLSTVEGQVDRLVPYFDYEAVLAHVLQNHTDVLTARNNLEGARYGLKLARATPVPDIDVRGDLFKEHQVFPLQNYYQLSIGIPFPIWDRNQGNIRTAAAGLARAAEGPHQVEVALTSSLAAAYASYKTNLAAVEYYRRDILPDQVRYYRGVFERRRIDPSVAFGDLVQAQQVLVADVTAYLGILGSLWNSVVSVADFIQTDDLYQLGKPLELPELPDLETLHAWPCPHPPMTAEPLETPPAPPAPAGPQAARGPRAATTPPRGTTNDSRTPSLEPPLIASNAATTRVLFDKLFGKVDSTLSSPLPLRPPSALPAAQPPPAPAAPDSSRPTSPASSRSAS